MSDLLQDLNIVEPSAPPAEDVFDDDEKPSNCEPQTHTDIRKYEPIKPGYIF